MIGRRVVFAGLLLAALPLLVQAQSSDNYSLEESTLNCGGDPHNGVVLTSDNYRITLDAVGDAVSSADMSSENYGGNGGFAAGYPPPGEVLNVQFADEETLTWDPERSVGTYTLYRGDIADLPGSYGSAEQEDLPEATATDTAEPDPGQCLFYLVTAENRIEEEGTKGADSSGGTRP